MYKKKYINHTIIVNNKKYKYDNSSTLYDNFYRILLQVYGKTLISPAIYIEKFLSYNGNYVTYLYIYVNFNSFMIKDIRICNRCVMDTRTPEIYFDKDGNCNFCNEFLDVTQKKVHKDDTPDKKLFTLFDEIKATNKKPYNCLIGISGGVDSIYTAYLAKLHGLSPLGVHMDNGWNSEIAVRNIEKVLKKLGIDLYTYVLDWEEFRDLQLSFLKASVPEAENPTDIAIMGVLHEVAAKFGIKHILSGGNYATEGILPTSFQYNPKDVTYLKAIHKQFGKGVLNKFPTFGYQREIYYKFVKGIKIYYPLNYINYSKHAAKDLLINNFEWENYGGKHHESIYTKFIQSYYLPVKFGYDYRQATFSTQICTGEISRDEALEELKKPSYDTNTIKELKNYVAKKFDIGVEVLESIIALPPKTYKDYPNDSKLLTFVYSTYKKIMKK
ncbi:MAG: N-acetyl sugar amidotransferase [Bacteroidales bacterium]